MPQMARMTRMARMARGPQLRRAIVIALLAASAGVASAHEAERTRVTITFAPDGRFVVEVANDPTWMLMRLETFAGRQSETGLTAAQRDERLAQLGSVFADRIVLFVDGHEVRADAVEYQPPPDQQPGAGAEAGGSESSRPLARFRLTGSMPRDARTLRWLYGLVADPYPLEIRQPDGSSNVEWIHGANWSDVIDLTRSFTRPTRWQIARQYLWLGYTHILPKGLDHILFVIGLFLLSPRLAPLLTQVTAFTIAHSITLALAMYGVVSLPSRVVEPLIALSIAYVAIENVVTPRLRPWRVALVFGFGLLHGLGFAGVLRELGLPREEFVTALVTFNLGVELGQLTVIAIAAAVVARFIRREWYRWRIVVPVSAAIAAIGIYWTVMRIV